MTTSAYLHIPFCATRCDYCDFATWTDKHTLMDRYVAACRSEVQRQIREPVDTVFVGGGTPTLLPADKLCELLAAIPLAPGAEVTVESNPETMSEEYADRLAAVGVTRVSVGMQSVVPETLQQLGRTHDPDSVPSAVAAVRNAGISHCNVDLIYGADGETLDQWQQSLEAAVELPVDHVSAYALTVEPGTPLATLVSSGERNAPDEELQADKYLLADEMLTANGFTAYEISNWAKPGGVCRHNFAYWNGGAVIPIGCAAHGFDGNRRMWTIRTPERYLAAVESGGSPLAGEEELDVSGRQREQFMLQFRTTSGVTAAEPGSTEERLEQEFVDSGLLERIESAEGTRIRLTVRGRLLANPVTIALMDERFPAPMRR